MPKDNKYTASDITVLEGLEAVRKRPGMYIGTTGVDGIYHLITEIFDNSRDEAMAGHANRVEIIFLPNQTIRVADNGRGIPVDTHKKTKTSALETIMTTLHAGGKFGDSGYKVSGGLHGVGASVVNALSDFTKVYVHRDGEIHNQSYKVGKADSKVKVIGKTKKSGTVIEFRPDEEMFKGLKFDNSLLSVDRVLDHIRDQAYLVKDLRVCVIDARDTKVKIPEKDLFVYEHLYDSPSYSFCFQGGLRSFVKHHNNYHKPIHDEVFHTEGESNGVGVKIAFQYVDDISSRIFAFGNTIKNPEGGTHVTGFKTSLTRTLNSYSKKKKLVKEGETFTGDDVLEGITAVISVTLKEIQFEGQTKSKLGSVEARSAVETVLSEALSSFLEENPTTAKQIINKVDIAYQARKAAKAAKDSVLRKGALDGLTLPGKLADCQVKNSEEAELFIVEGDSAGGTAKLGRDRRTQAILPIRGKILNVEKARLDKVLGSEEVRKIIIALGTTIGDTFDLDKLRYGKIIIATDADVDGAHIRALLLTLFYKYFIGLIENGNIYFAQPPLFKVKKGKEEYYAHSEEERDKIIKKFEAKSKKTEEEEKSKGIFVQRYKGLGEMNYEELWETTMNPEKRVIKRVKIEDAEEAEKTFSTLMGSEVLPRKNFIQKNAKFASLDV